MNYTVPRPIEWPLRSDEERGRALDRCAIEDADTLVAWQAEGSGPSRPGPRLLRIFGDADEAGTGTPASRELDRFFDGIRIILSC